MPTLSPTLTGLPIVLDPIATMWPMPSWPAVAISNIPGIGKSGVKLRTSDNRRLRSSPIVISDVDVGMTAAWVQEKRVNISESLSR